MLGTHFFHTKEVSVDVLREYSCPVEVTVRVIGGKWKIVILSHLIREEVIRFGEMKRLIPEVTQQMLTKQLRELEANNIIHREAYPQVPPKVEYSLTPLGKSLVPIVKQMKAWGESYIEAANI